MPHRLIAACVVFLCACGSTSGSTSVAPTEPSATPAQASATATAANTGGYAVDSGLMTAARSPSTDKIELQIAADGTVTKQAVYTTDSSAVPPEVVALAKEKIPGGTIKAYELELYGSDPVFEVEVMAADGHKCEVSAKADGTLVYVECEFDRATLAEPIKAKVAELYPQGKIAEAETKKGPDLDLITVEVIDGGREYYLHFSPAGEVKAKFVKVPGEFSLEI